MSQYFHQVLYIYIYIHTRVKSWNFPRLFLYIFTLPKCSHINCWLPLLDSDNIYLLQLNTSTTEMLRPGLLSRSIWPLKKKSLISYFSAIKSKSILQNYVYTAGLPDPDQSNRRSNCHSWHMSLRITFCIGYIYIYIYIYIYVDVCVCVCVCGERERERKREFLTEWSVWNVDKKTNNIDLFTIKIKHLSRVSLQNNHFLFSCSWQKSVISRVFIS